jgi:hypothetical protein
MELPAVQFNFEMARDKENTAKVLHRIKIMMKNDTTF